MSFYSPLEPRTSKRLRVGVSGTGFIAQGLMAALANADDFELSQVLTRRKLGDVEGVDRDLLTDSIDRLAESSDIVVECSGDVKRGADVVQAAFNANRPVVTMGTEFHVTVGSYFVDRGYLTEAEGDQPGSLAAHAEEVISMGFKPIVYGNIKGFLNHGPTPEEMEYWASKNGISIEQTISFTDGTKMQMEQALVANGLGAGIACRGMLGIQTMPLEVAGSELGRRAKKLEMPLSDYVLNRTLPAGVFIVAEHPFERSHVLRYLKLGDGPYYTLLRGYHLCHLEMLKTLRRTAAGGSPLLNNSTKPRVTVAAVTKQNLPKDYFLERAAGGYDVRGEAVMINQAPDAVPIGLLDRVRINKALEKGQTITWDDVEIPESLALTAALAIKDRAEAVYGA